MLVSNYFFQAINARNSEDVTMLTVAPNSSKAVDESLLNTKNSSIPIARMVYESQSMSLPNSVGTFIWYIVNEAHEDTNKEPQKLMSDHNPNYIPTKLIMPQGVSLLFLDTDAPWDTPHPHTIKIKDKDSGKVV